MGEPTSHHSRSLQDRVRVALTGRGLTAQERRMFGAQVFMVQGQILVGVRDGIGLLVRCDPARHAELTARPGARTATMGGREMGPAWLDVDAEVLTSDDELDLWLEVAASRPR